MHLGNISGGVPNEILNIFTGFRVDFCKILQVSGSILGGGWCRGACLRGNVQGARTQVFKMLEDPGSKLSSCNFHALGSNYVSVAAAGALWLPLKRLTLYSIS